MRRRRVDIHCFVLVGRGRGLYAQARAAAGHDYLLLRGRLDRKVPCAWWRRQHQRGPCTVSVSLSPLQSLPLPIARQFPLAPCPTQAHLRLGSLLFLLPSPPWSARDPPCLACFFLHTLLELRLHALARVGPDVPAGEDRVGRGVFVLCLDHCLLEVRVEALLRVRVVERARVRCRRGVREQRVRRWMLAGACQGLELDDAVEQGTRRCLSQMSHRTSRPERGRTCVHSAIVLRARPKCEAR